MNIDTGIIRRLYSSEKPAAREAGTKTGATTNEAKWRVWLDSAPKEI